MKTLDMTLLARILVLATIGVCASPDFTRAQSAPDSVVAMAADSAGLSLADPTTLPPVGTFWMVLSNGIMEPYPAPVFDLSLPVYGITDNEFLVDGTGGQVAPSPWLMGGRRAMMAASISTVAQVQMDKVTALINQVEDVQAAQQMRTLAMAVGAGMDSPVFQFDGTSDVSSPDFNIPAPDYGTNLWIAQTIVAGGYLSGIGSNTLADVEYEIQSCTDLSVRNWQSEGFIYGSELTNWTPFSVARQGRPILFLRLRSWIDSYDICIPDWWQLQYFGTIGIDPNASVAGDGYSNLQKFQMGLNPTNYYNPNAVPGFFGALDVSGTNVVLEWSNAPGPVVNYAVQRGILNPALNTYSYSQIGLASSNKTFFVDAGAINGTNAQNNIYNVMAVYPGGSLSVTNTWNVSWYIGWGGYGPPYGPPLPGNFWANADATGTNVMLSWLPASPTTTNYIILRGIYNSTNYTYTYTQITNASPATTNLELFGALTNDSNWTDVYEVEAVYPGGGLSVPASTYPDWLSSSHSSINVGANTNAPAAPGNFYGYTDPTGTNIFLTWSPVSGAAANYIIYGGVFDSGTSLVIYHKIGQMGTGTTSFEVAGGIDGTGNNIYDVYSIVAVYADGSLSQAATWYSGSGSPTPGALYAWLDSTGTNVQLSWTAVSGGATGYLIQRSDYGAYYPWTFYEVGQVGSGTTSFVDVDAVNTGSFALGTTVYEVQAVYPNGGLSPAATATVTNVPPPPGSLSSTVDTTGTNVLLSWTPAPGAVTGYSIERGVFNQTTGNYDYTQIATVGADTTSYTDIGAVAGRNASRNIYQVSALYAGGAYSLPVSSALIPMTISAPAARLAVSAQMVRNQTGHWQLMFSGIPTNVQSILVDWCYYDYFYQWGATGDFVFDPFDDYVYQEAVVPVSGLTNGIYVLPDWQTTNYFPNSAIGVEGYVRAMDAQGNIGDPSESGFLRYDSPTFVDARQHLKQNLRFELRAATESRPNVSLVEHNVYWAPDFWDVSIPTDTNYVESSLFHWSQMFNDYGGEPAYIKMDDVWPITVNYQLHPGLYDPNYIGTNFVWQPNPWVVAGGNGWAGEDISTTFEGTLATIPAPAVLGVSDPYWIAQSLAMTQTGSGIDPATGLPQPPTYTVADSPDLAVYTNNGSVYLQSGAHNLFGLPFQTALVNQGGYYWYWDGTQEVLQYDPIITLAPGGSTAMTNVSCFFSQTADPSLSLVNYYFAPVNTPGTALADVNTPNQLYPIPALTGFAVTNQTGLLITSVGTPTVIGGWAKFAIQNGSANKFAYLGQYYVTNAFVVTHGIVTTNTTGVVSPYGDFFPTEPGVAAMVSMPDIDTGAQGTGIVRVVSLNVDANHDGTMDFTYQGPDFVSAGKPFRFWVNDNQDEGDFTGDGIPGKGSQGDGVTKVLTMYNPNTPGSTYDNVFAIHGRRDLVDFFPVCLNIGSLFQSNVLSAGISATDTNYQFVLSQADGVLRFAYTDLTPTNYMNFLQDTNVSGNLAYAPLTTISNTGVALPQSFVSGIATNNQSIILVEAAVATTQPLVLTVYHGSNQVAQVSLPLSISGVEQMFRHKNLLLSANPVKPDRLTDADVPNEPDTIDKNFVFLHGYNVLPDEARGVAADMFKRLYWSGSHAKFYAVTWEGADTKGSPPFYNKLTPNYHTNVYNAFLTAPSLANFIGALTNSGPVVAAAHSLGNMVVLSAISDWNAPISQYFMLDAAVPIEAIDSSATTNMMIYSTWLDYSNRLFAANWYQLFATNDARSTLNWNNRLGNFGSVDVYNFYSSGEEVLRTYIGDPPDSVLNMAGTQIFNNLWSGVPFGTGTWYWQEKGKGICTQDWFLGSSHGGWRFSDYYYGVPVVSANSTAYTPNSMLPQHPFFDFSRAALVGPPSPDLALTNNSSGSGYAAANRNRILADAIPAMSLVAGANPVPRLSPPRNLTENNLNMNTPLFQNGWAQGRLTSGEKNNDWYHSDFVQMAYTFTYRIFNQFVTTGNLK